MSCLCTAAIKVCLLVSLTSAASSPPFLSVPPSLTPMVVSCLPAFLHRLDSQSSEGQRQRHITHPPPGLDELPVCLQSPEQQRRQTGNVRCSCAACVCVSVCLCVRVSTSVPLVFSPSPSLSVGTCMDPVMCGCVEVGS